MITLEEHRTRNVVELQARGRLTAEDYAQIAPRLEQLLERDEPLRCYVDLEGFQGWEPRALAEEIKFDVEHRSRFGRMAVVGDSRLTEWGVALSNLFFPSEVRYFSRDKAGVAREWVRRDDPAVPVA